MLPPRQVEALDRGIVAVRRGTTSAYISWRLLGKDPTNVAFNLYRSANNATPVKLNASPLTTTTDYVDTTLNTAVSNRYYVRPVVNAVEQASSISFTLAANTAIKQYLSIPLQIPAPVTTPDGVVHNYTANDASVGDLDGDGAYEYILKWEATESAASSYNANVYLDAYKLDGTRLWRASSGPNIKTGAQFLQFIVYDFDGDGKAEVAFNSADGAVSGTGQVIGDATRDWRSTFDGYVTTGPEYLTLLKGTTGEILANTNLAPARGTVTDWGDDYGHRSNTFNASVAYLDGQRPSLIFGRGIYHGRDGNPGKTQIVAWDWRNGQLTKRWTFTAASNGANPTYVGQGNHNSTVGDVDGDGRDEIVWGAMAVNDDGTPLYSTRLGHGDALHMSDMIPSRPGLEVFGPHESPTEYNRDVNGDGVSDDNGGALFDAATGEVLLSIPGGTADVGRGVAFDIDPRPGYEMWTSANGSIYNVDGTIVAAKPSNMFQNFGVWWDADLYRELLDQTTIGDWNFTTDGRVNFDLDPATSGVNQYAPGSSSNNSTKSTPALSGDLFGDWREEVMWRTSDNTELRIFTTMIPATSRLVTLMHDTQYRQAIAWQNVFYNQPPHPSFFLGNGMTTPPPPNIYLAGVDPIAPTIVVAATATPSPAHSRRATLSVLGDDANTGEASLIYTWSVIEGEANSVTFAVNGTNTAKTTTVTFAAEGSYTFRVTITDPTNATATSTTSVVVNDEVVIYNADATSGTTLTDSSGNNKTATLNGSYTFAPGVTGNAVKLTGGAATLPAGIVSGLDDFTIGAWVKPDAANNWARIFDFGNSSSAYMFLTARSGTTGNTLRFAITTAGNAGEQIVNGPALSLGVWTHVAVTLSGNTATLYVNGAAVGTNANVTLRPASLGNTTNNYIGDSQFAGDPNFLGSIDDFRIVGRALSSAEIASIATPPDTVAPSVSASTFAYQTGHAIHFTLSEDVIDSVDLEDLSIVDVTTGLRVPASQFTVAIEGGAGSPTTVTWTRDPASGPLADGNYRATLPAGSVADRAGNAITADASLNFHVLAGDANRDRTVNFADLVILAQNYNQAGKTFSQGNFNYSSDGKVDFADLVLLAQRYNTSLPIAPPAAPLTAGTSASRTGTVKRKGDSVFAAPEAI